MIDSASARVLFDAGLDHLGWWADSGEAAVRLLRALTTRSGTGADSLSDTLMYHQFLALELAYRGHLQEAYAADRRLLLDPSASRFSQIPGSVPQSQPPGGDPGITGRHNLWTGVRAWKSVADASLHHRRGNCEASPGGWPEETRRRWRGSRSAPSRKPERRRAPAASSAADTSTLPLRRISRWLERDSAEALRLFQAIPDTLCIVNDCFYEKLIEARLLTSQGQARQAGAVLDRWVWSGGGPALRPRRPGAGPHRGESGRASEGDRLVPVRGRCLAACRPRAGTVCTRGSCGAGAAGG